jgi:hypothetical protein
MLARNTFSLALSLTAAALGMNYAAKAVMIDFNGVAAGAFGCCGVNFVAPNVDPACPIAWVPFVTRPLRAGGAWVYGGNAAFLPGGYLGSGSLQLNNVCVAPNLAALACVPFPTIIDFDYRDTGAPINLYVQNALGAMRDVQPNFGAIAPAAFIPTTNVWFNHAVTAAGAGWVEGHVQLVAFGPPILNLQIGGQNLQIDNLRIQ